MTDTITLKALVRDVKTGKDVLVDEKFVVVLIKNRRYTTTGIDGPFYILASAFGNEKKNTLDRLRCYRLQTEHWGHSVQPRVNRTRHFVQPRVNRTRHFFDVDRSQLVLAKLSTTEAEVDNACENVQKDTDIAIFDKRITDLIAQIDRLADERTSLAWKRQGVFQSKVLDRLGIVEQVEIAKSQTASS